jgi:hypothetical protein
MLHILKLLLALILVLGQVVALHGQNFIRNEVAASIFSLTVVILLSQWVIRDGILLVSEVLTSVGAAFRCRISPDT